MSYEKYTPPYTYTLNLNKDPQYLKFMIWSSYDYELRQDSDRRAHLIFLSLHLREKILAESGRQFRCWGHCTDRRGLVMSGPWCHISP